MANASDYQVGMLVRNVKAPGWGPGKILALEGQTAVVYFRDFPETNASEALKRIDLTMGVLEVLRGQSDMLLDNLPPFVDGKLQISRPRLTIDQAIAVFSDRFPRGFEDPRYLGDKTTGERVYKSEAHELWRKTLGDGEGRRLLKRGDVSAVVARALAVDGRLNLLAVFEKAALRDGLKDSEAARRYFTTLFALLEARDPSRQLFEAHVEALSGLPALEGRAPVTRWPILTLFPLIARPEQFMFLKPGVTKDCADRLAFNLEYSARLNWTTYERLLTMSKVLFDRLRSLGARDFIDVQSFIWLIGHSA